MDEIKKIKGGVCAARGFLAGATGCGIKNGTVSRDDLALVVSEVPATAAGTFTTNQVQAAPVKLSRAHLKSKTARAVLLNSGNANACTGQAGLADARRMAQRAAEALGVQERAILVCSTGRIGVRLPMARIEAGIPGAVAGLNARAGTAAARAIMTSDTRPKEFALEVSGRRGIFHLGGMAKGAGMIDPNMATMLAVITTDAAVAKPVLQRALRAAVEKTFNRITVDGDMSTNDTVLCLANGASGISMDRQEEDYDLFCGALQEVCGELARAIVLDGEGVSRLVEVEVHGAATAKDARRAAEAIANSTLVKCAWAGGDPNWGRILDALGYSGARMREEKTHIFYDAVPLVRQGVEVPGSFAKAKRIAARKAFRVTVELGLGRASHDVLTTDLTEEYVRLNLGE